MVGHAVRSYHYLLQRTQFSRGGHFFLFFRHFDKVHSAEPSSMILSAAINMATSVKRAKWDLSRISYVAESSDQNRSNEETAPNVDNVLSARRESKCAHITENCVLNQFEGFGSVREWRISYVFSGNFAVDTLKLHEGPLHRSGSASNPKAGQKVLAAKE